MFGEHLPSRSTGPALAALLLATLAPGLCEAQFLDLLKDKAAKAVQKKMDPKPADPPKSPDAGASAPAATGAAPGAAAPAAAPAAPSLQAYQGYDFVPGDTIVFEDNFEKDEDGEFPSHWTQLDGQGAVNTTAGRRAFALMAPDYRHVTPAIKAQQYLSDAWTLEFDVYAISGAAPRVYFFNSTKEMDNLRNSIGGIRHGSNNWHTFDLDFAGKNQQQPNPDFMQQPGFLNNWHHIAVAFKERRLKIYVDQFRIYSLQDFKVSPRAVSFDSTGTNAKPQLITNVRIANGAGIKIVDKKFTDAKIVTHGINFDNDKATLKPESMGTLNMIVDILKNNPEIRFEIQGHTDNSGAAAHNLTLSQQRADVVKQQLVAMGVDGGRLTTKGLGDTKPMADNTTLEGRANNRRVEFITQK